MSYELSTLKTSKLDVVVTFSNFVILANLTLEGTEPLELILRKSLIADEIFCLRPLAGAAKIMSAALNIVTPETVITPVDIEPATVKPKLDGACLRFSAIEPSILKI